MDFDFRLVLNVAANSIADEEIDDIAQKIMFEIEHKSSKELADSDEIIKILHLTNIHHAKTLLQHEDETSKQSTREIGRKAVIKALLISTWLQRLYFVIRSMIMGIISASISFGFLLFFGSINLPLEVVLGIFSFVISLGASRLLDVQIVKATKKVVAFLGDHKKLRNFILNHF
jgi:hypothetical protein